MHTSLLGFWLASCTSTPFSHTQLLFMPHISTHVFCSLHSCIHCFLSCFLSKLNLSLYSLTIYYVLGTMVGAVGSAVGADESRHDFCYHGSYNLSKTSSCPHHHSSLPKPATQVYWFPLATVKITTDTMA